MKSFKEILQEAGKTGMAKKAGTLGPGDEIIVKGNTVTVKSVEYSGKGIILTDADGETHTYKKNDVVWVAQK